MQKLRGATLGKDEEPKRGRSQSGQGTQTAGVIDREAAPWPVQQDTHTAPEGRTAPAERARPQTHHAGLPAAALCKEGSAYEH